MTDPHRKYRAGDKFRPSARQLNSWIDAAAATGGGLQNPKSLIPELNVGVVLVRNDTGSDLTGEHDVIGLSTPLIVPADRDTVVYERPVFSGVAPSDNRWGVLLQPLADGAIGKAVVSGVTWAEVDIIDEAHEFCTADSGTLESAEAGCGFLLWQASGTGVQWALIRISNFLEEEAASGSDSTGSLGSESGSGKDTAVVPASWCPSGYTALFVEEAPEVRFDDLLVAECVPSEERVWRVPIDPRFLEVCEPGSIEVCGTSCDRPVTVGTRVEDDAVALHFGEPQSHRVHRVVVRLTGIRKDFAGIRFPDRTRAQFEANERWINRGTA